LSCSEAETYLFGEKLVTGFLGLCVHASRKVVEVVAFFNNLWAVEMVAKTQSREAGALFVVQPACNDN
jgi:hypothetical protein